MPTRKATTAEYRALCINDLKRKDGLTPNTAFRWCWWRDGKEVASINITVGGKDSIHLSYNANGKPLGYDVPLEWTVCHLGGERPWFLCPTCNRRVGKLYGAVMFECRHCLRLNYASQQMNKRDRANDRAWDLRLRLGCNDPPWTVPALCIPKPKGMHWSTYQRRVAALDAMEQKALQNLAAVLGMFERRIN